MISVSLGEHSLACASLACPGPTSPRSVDLGLVAPGCQLVSQACLLSGNDLFDVTWYLVISSLLIFTSFELDQA